MALYCLDESESISPKIQPRLERVIYRCLANEELTSIIANAFTEIRKSRMVRIAAKKFVDPKLITHAEYQVFLHEKKKEGDYHQPDHWLTTNFPQSLAREPVVGVRLEDAIAFCSWLTENEGGGQWRFRLPKLAELQGRGFFGLQIEEPASYWVQERGHHTCLGGQLKSALDVAEVRKQVLADVQLDNGQYVLKDTFPADHQMILPQALRLQLEAFDFSQFNSRQYLQAIHAYAGEMPADAHTKIEMLEPLVQHLTHEAQEFRKLIQQIEMSLNEGHANIYSWEAERDAALNEITAMYAEPYGRIEQHVQQAKGDLEEQKRRRQEIESETETLFAQIDEQKRQRIAQIQEFSAEAESQARSENEEIRTHYEKQYQALDAEKSRFEADINRFEGMRGEYTDESINEIIENRREILAKIEENRRELKASEEANYQHVSTQKNEILAEYRSRIDEIKRQAKSNKEQITQHDEGNYAIIRQNITTIQANISQFQDNRRQLKQEERERKTSVSSQAEDHITTIRNRMADLSAQQDDYKKEEKSFRTKAKFIRESKTILMEYAQAVLEMVLTLDEFLADYFTANAAHTIQVSKNIESIISRFEELLRLCRQYIGSPEQSSAVRYLRSALREAEAAKETVLALHRYVENAELLNRLLTTTCDEFQVLLFGDLPEVVFENAAHRKRYRSLELAYNFLRYRGREQRPQAARQTVYDQLHYVRLGVLSLLSACLEQGSPDRLKMAQFSQLYASFYALVARMKGELPALEGIRLIKERVVRQENK